jgi:hypothetical protein
VTVKRAKGPLVFDLGICLVLITLPTLALFVAIQMLTGRRQFLPPFSTWYAAMLFAGVPLRNILPGAPPAGSWIDQAVVIWVADCTGRGSGAVYRRVVPTLELRRRVHGHVVPTIGLERVA